jgi:hypothetical protein
MVLKLGEEEKRKVSVAASNRVFKEFNLEKQKEKFLSFYE